MASDNNDAARQEMNEYAIAMIAQVLANLANRYNENFQDAFELNKEFINIITLFLGEIIGHYPDEQRDTLFENAVSRIEQIMVETNSEIVSEQEDFDDEINGLVDIIMGRSKNDLSNMDPKGSC